MENVQKISNDFSKMLVMEVYGSIFYLFMKNDKNFLRNFQKNLIKSDFFLSDFKEPFEIVLNDFEEKMKELIQDDNTSNLNDTLDNINPR